VSPFLRVKLGSEGEGIYSRGKFAAFHEIRILILKHGNCRKLEIVLRELIPLAKHGKVTRFLNSADDVDRLDGLAGDIRDAMMDYQVRPQSTH